MATIASLTAKIAQFFTASDKAHQIVNGADNATVTTEAGELPTMAKALKDFQDKSVRYDIDQTDLDITAKQQAVKNISAGLVLTRTAAEGAPSNGGLLITGSLTSDGVTPWVQSGPYLPAGTLNGKTRYSFDPDNGLEIAGAFWSGTKWSMGDVYRWESNENVDTPDQVSVWVPSGANTGDPVVTIAEATIPDFIGQRCIVGDDGAGDDIGNGNRLEYTSLDGITWTLTGPANVQEDEATTGNLIVTTYGAGAVPTHESKTITDYLTA